MHRLIEVVEKIVVYALIVMIIVVVLAATGELGVIIVRDLASSPRMMLEIPELLDIFGFFLLILIGLELLETIRAYLVEHSIHVEIVLEVALIAIARKVIILDLKDYPSLTVVAIAALIVALAIAFYIEKVARRARPATAPKEA